jgi:hypothetical protein
MRNNLKFMLIFLLFFTLLSNSYVYAQVIDFETVPGVGIPTACMEINTQYQSLYGVTFSLEGGGSPRIAQVGDPLEAFMGPPNNTLNDMPASGQNIGNYFLTDDCTLGLTAAPLVVNYNPPTAAASGVILDIDLNEQFTIQARDAGNNVIQTITINAGDPGTGDGIATPWSFDLGSPNIYSIRFVGTKPGGGFGLGFDNFYARAAEPPTTQVPTMTEWGMIIFIVLAGMGSIYYLRRKATKS